MALYRSIGAALEDDNSGTTTLDVRKDLTGLFPRAGVLPGGASPLVTGYTGAFVYLLLAESWVTQTATGDGYHLWGNDGYVTVGTSGVGGTVPAAPGSGLSRIDRIWILHPSTDTGAANSTPVAGVTCGTAASSPTAPAIPAGAFELARNTMTSAATSCVSTGNTITQTASYTSAAGAPTPVRTQAERDGLTAYDGLSVYRLDTHQIEVYDGTTWSNPNSLFSVVGASVYGSNYNPAKAVRRAILRSVASTTSGGLTNAISMPSGLTALLDVHATLVYPGSPSPAILLMRLDASAMPTSLTYQLRNSTTDVGISLAAYDIRLEVIYQV